MNHTVGSRIKELREEMHMTQKELADSLNIDQSGISRIETDSRELDRATLIKLADLFHTTCDYILGASNKRERTHSKLTTEEDYVLTSFQKSSDSTKGAIINIFKNINETQNNRL